MKKRGKYGISRYSFSLSANPKKDLNLFGFAYGYTHLSSRESIFFGEILCGSDAYNFLRF